MFFALGACASVPGRSDGRANLRAFEPLAADSAARCIPDSTMFDWQALDTRDVVIWAESAGDLYEVALARPIEGLNGAPAGALELVDADHDGYICGEGTDSIAAWTVPMDDPEVAEMPIGTADVYYIDRLNALALSERLETHAGTLGPRGQSRFVD